MIKRAKQFLNFEDTKHTIYRLIEIIFSIAPRAKNKQRGYDTLVKINECKENLKGLSIMTGEYFANLPGIRFQSLEFLYIYIRRLYIRG